MPKQPKVTVLMDEDTYKRYVKMVNNDHFYEGSDTSRAMGPYALNILNEWMDYRQEMKDTYGIEFVTFRDALEAAREPDVVLSNL